MLKLAAALPFLITSLLGAPQRGAQHPPGMRGGLLGRLLSPRAVEVLQLTEDQIDELEELRSSAEKQALEIKQKMERTRLELAELMREDNPSQSKIEAKVKEIGSLRTELHLFQVEVFFAAREILTSEQIDKIKTLAGPPGLKDGPPSER